MKKAVVGLAALGAVLGLHRVGARMRQAMLRHCEQLASRCRAMSA